MRKAIVLLVFVALLLTAGMCLADEDGALALPLALRATIDDENVTILIDTDGHWFQLQDMGEPAELIVRMCFFERGDDQLLLRINQMPDEVYILTAMEGAYQLEISSPYDQYFVPVEKIDLPSFYAEVLHPEKPLTVADLAGAEYINPDGTYRFSEEGGLFFDGGIYSDPYEIPYTQYGNIFASGEFLPDDLIWINGDFLHLTDYNGVHDLNHTFIRARDERDGVLTDKLSWRYDQGTLSISGSGPMPDWNNDRGADAPWYRFSSTIERIIVGEGVTHIGNYSFQGNFSQLQLPSTLKSIGNYAISSLALQELALPEGLETLGEGALASNGISELILPDTVTSMGVGALRDCGFLKNVKLSERLTTIPEYAFAYCGNLEEITLPASVTRVEDRAFLDCFNLKKLTYHKGTKFGIDVFSGCKYTIERNLLD